MSNSLFDATNYYLNPFAIPVLFVSILIFFIGIFVFRQNRKAIINIAFFFITLSTGFWLFTISLVYFCRNPRVALIWYRYFTFLGVCNIMPSLLFFASTWLGELKRQKYFLITDYTLSLIFYILAITTDKLIYPHIMRRYFWGYYPVYLVWMIPFLIFFIVQIVLTLKKLYSAYQIESNPIKKKSKKIVLLASIIGFTSAMDFMPKLTYLPWLYPYGYITMFIYILLIAYSIIKYRTFDIETVIHKTAVWFLTFSFIMLPIFFVYRYLFPYIKDLSSWQITFWVISFLTVAFYLRIIQPRIDHLFQRRRVDLEEISSRFTEDLVHLKSLNQLIQRIEDTIADTLYPERIDTFIFNAEKNNYKLVSVRNISRPVSELDREGPFLLWLSKNDKIVHREFLDMDPAFATIKETANTYFNLINTQVIIPLVLSDRLLGVIHLGKKVNLKHYTAAEFNFLNGLKNQSTIAISNSLLYQNIEEQVKQRTNELVEVQKQLIQAEKLATVGTLAGGVAHEINNPLTAILTNVQMLLAENKIDDKLDRESLELIEEATKRCRTIVQKLMTYAKKPLEPSAVNKVVELSDAVKNVITFLGYQLEQENIKIVVDTGEDDYLVIGNQNELEQVLTNIILNARDAIRQVKKNGVVRISLSKDNKWISINIKDEGIGMSGAIISKIFDPFFTTKEVGKGVGLGLSICQSIIEKHNGLITVQSEPNKGSVFTVQLPKA